MGHYVYQTRLHFKLVGGTQLDGVPGPWLERRGGGEGEFSMIKLKSEDLLGNVKLEALTVDCV